MVILLFKYLQNIFTPKRKFKNEWVNNRAVCRTALDRLRLLTIMIIQQEQHVETVLSSIVWSAIIQDKAALYYGKQVSNMVKKQTLSATIFISIHGQTRGGLYVAKIGYLYILAFSMHGRGWEKFMHWISLLSIPIFCH